MLKTQEGMDFRLEQRDEELRQLRSQSQVNGAQLAALSLQMQELISSVEARAKVVGRDLEEINGRFDRHRGEINRLKIREKDAKEETEQLKGFIVGAGHEAQVFKNRLDRMEENVCRCGRTPSEVGEEFVSSEDEGRMELSYASVREDEYVAPPVENSIPLPIPALAPCCQGSHPTPPALEEMSQIQSLTSKISHICQEIRDIKSRRRPQTNIAIQNYTNTGLVEGQTNPNYTRAPDSNNFAKEGSDDEDGLGETYSSHSKLCHRAPNNPDIPSHHAPSLPSLSPPPSESIVEPPGDLSPSPTSRIATLSPSLLS